MRRLGLALVVLATCACGDTEDDGASGGASGSGGAGGSAGSATGGSSGSAAGSGGSGAIGGSAGQGGATGGSGGTAGSAGSTGGSAGSTGGSAGASGMCASLLAEMQKTLDAALACSPMLPVVQCSGSETSYDVCGCEVVLNETQPNAVKAAQDAYQAWVDAGCGPYGCGKPCALGNSGVCDPTSGTCRWM